MITDPYLSADRHILDDGSVLIHSGQLTLEMITRMLDEAWNREFDSFQHKADNE